MTRRVLRRPLLASVVLCLALVALMLPGALTSAKGGDKSGPRAIAHKAGGKRVAAPVTPPDAKLHYLGVDTAEPTLGLTKSGDIFFSAYQTTTRVEVMRSQDGGFSWEIVSPQFAESRNAQLISLDPYVWVDERTSRVYTIDLTVACSYLSFSDDLEVGWTTNPIACGRPVNDHQTLFGGPPVSSDTFGYDNIVYYCWNDVATSSCSKSLDGGLTFAPTGSPAFHPADDAQTDCHPVHGGLHGHGVVGDDGTIYLPKEHCNQPWVGVSKDEGRSWSHFRVSKHRALWGPDPSVDVDSKGNIYYVYLAEKDRLPYLVTSKNDGKTWSKPKMLGFPGLTETVHATVDVGKPGSVAVAYYGTDDVKGPIEDREYTQEVEWNGYMTMTTDALSKDPIFFSGNVNDLSDPFARGPCGPRRCYDAIDFIDVVIGRNGIPYGAFADSCSGPCAGPGAKPGTSGAMGVLVGGPRLR